MDLEDDHHAVISENGNDSAWNRTRRIIRDWGIDRTVVFAATVRFWQLLSGPITALLILFSFDVNTQDFYYAFSSMLGTQVFIELGLHVVIINIASHEWARLKLVDGIPMGDDKALGRLASLLQMTQVWYCVASLLFVGAVLASGIMFFSNSRSDFQPIAWLAPWVFFVLLNGVQFAFLPSMAILEGCGQLQSIYRVRLIQALLGSFTVWMLIYFQQGLWALVGSAGVRLLCDFYLLGYVYRPFLMKLLTQQRLQDASISWRNEIYPLQWRMAIQGCGLWFASQMPLLAIMKHPGETGKLGMTWAILTAIQSATVAIVETRRPLFGAFIADKRYHLLDSTFFRLSRASMGLLAVGLLAFWLMIWFLGTRPEWLFQKVTARMLPADSVFIFCIAFLGYQVSMLTGIYIRAHRRDPFLWVTVVSCLVLAVAQYWLGTRWGGRGVAIGYCLGVCLVLLPWGTIVWQRCRQKWHSDALGAEASHGDQP